MLANPGCFISTETAPQCHFVCPKCLRATTFVREKLVQKWRNLLAGDDQLSWVWHHGNSISDIDAIWQHWRNEQRTRNSKWLFTSCVNVKSSTKLHQLMTSPNTNFLNVTVTEHNFPVHFHLRRELWFPCLSLCSLCCTFLKEFALLTKNKAPPKLHLSHKSCKFKFIRSTEQENRSLLNASPPALLSWNTTSAVGTISLRASRGRAAI